MGLGVGICAATLLADPMTAGDADARAAGEACLAAGVEEVSVWAHQVAALDGLGLRVVALEAAMTWANADAASAAAEADRLAHQAADLGSRKLVAVCMEAALDDLAHARANLAVLVGAVEPLGVQVCVEFLPFSGIPDLATAWRLVEPLGPSAGILLDTWHWQRQPGGPCPELLATIPGERIGYVQLCDAAAVPGDDAMTEAMTARLLPGDGVVDIAGVLAQLRAMGADPFVATEVFNPALVLERGPRGAAEAMVTASSGVLGRA